MNVNLSRRGFLRMLGASVPVAAIAPTYFFAPIGGWSSDLISHPGSWHGLIEDDVDQTGDPNQSFPPLNNFVYPSKVTRAWACTLGLIVFTVKDVYIVEGSATAQSPLTTRKYIGGLGLLSYDAFTVNKTTPYLMNSSNLVIALDPSSGLIEPGFPIAARCTTTKSSF